MLVFCFLSLNSLRKYGHKYEIWSKTGLLRVAAEIELKYKICDDSAKCNLMKFEREIAILKQGNEFLELQLKELNNQLEDQKRSHESILSKLEIKAFSQEGQEEFNRKIEELKEFFSNEKKQLNDNFEKSRQLYLTQVSILHKIDRFYQ